MGHPVPDDDATSRRPTADEGTHLGASTNPLTRLFAVVMWPIAAVSRVAHAIGRGIRRVFGGNHRFLRRLRAIATSTAALGSRALRGVGAALRPLGLIAGRV